MCLGSGVSFSKGEDSGASGEVHGGAQSSPQARESTAGGYSQKNGKLLTRFPQEAITEGPRGNKTRSGGSKRVKKVQEESE